MNETTRRPEPDQTWRRASNGRLYTVVSVDGETVTIVDERTSTIRIDRFLLQFDFERAAREG